MHRFTTGFGNLQINGVATLRRPTTRRVSALLAVAIMTVAPVFAKDPPATEIKAAAKPPVVRGQVQTDVALIPECLESLKLSPQQQDQVKEIIHNYNGSRAIVWKQFSDRYMQAIEMETSLLAAIEDNMTESQRQQLRNQRHKTAQHEKVIASTNTKVNQAAITANEETTKPATAAAEGLATAGVSLTEEQEAAADKIQEKYRAPLRSLNRDIQGLHTQLISLEADKLVEIEKVLTKDQITQLRTHRQNAPLAPKVASR